MSITTITPAEQYSLDRELVKRALPNLLHDKFGQKKNLKQKSGDYMRFRKYNALSTSPTPLTAGVTPTSGSFTTTDVDAQIKQYGYVLEYTDTSETMTQESVRMEVTGLLGEQAGETMDEVYRDTLVGGTSVLRANSVAGRTNIVTKVAEADLNKIIRALNNANAKPFVPEYIKPDGGYGTSPATPAFMAIIHPDALMDFEGLTLWVGAEKYQNQTTLYPGEVGKWKSFRFCLSTKSKIWADGGGTAVTNTLKYTTADTACDVYSALIFGQNAYGIIELDGEAMKTYYTDFGAGDDFLRQRAALGWKANATCKIINETFMYRYEFGVSR